MKPLTPTVSSPCVTPPGTRAERETSAGKVRHGRLHPWFNPTAKSCIPIRTLSNTILL